MYDQQIWFKGQGRHFCVVSTAIIIINSIIADELCHSSLQAPVEYHTGMPVSNELIIRICVR